MSKPRKQRIRTKLSSSPGFDVATFTGDRQLTHGRLQVGGWLQGRDSYLWLGVGPSRKGAMCVGIIGDKKLYRLAKAIVRHYEADK